MSTVKYNNFLVDRKKKQGTIKKQIPKKKTRIINQLHFQKQEVTQLPFFILMKKPSVEIQ